MGGQTDKGKVTSPFSIDDEVEKKQNFTFVAARLFIPLAPLLAVDTACTTPLALHPDNSHSFLSREKPTVLITSGEHYGAVLRLDFDYVKYLGTLAADELNLKLR